MPWLLLTEPLAVAKTTTRDDAWIAVGGLDRALAQAGMIEALLDAGLRPRLVCTGGMARVNAISCVRGDSRDVRRAWESLRAAGFLRRYALSSLGPRALFRRPPEALMETLSLVAPPTPNGSGGTEVRILEPAGSRRARADGSAEDLALAIDEATDFGARSVLLLGTDKTSEASDRVGAAIARARRAGRRVSTLALPPSQAPSLLDYLLPGLGGVERLMIAGRRSAESWLRSTDAE